jgi:hypothetical protein
MNLEEVLWQAAFEALRKRILSVSPKMALTEGCVCLRDGKIYIAGVLDLDDGKGSSDKFEHPGTWH